MGSFASSGGYGCARRNAGTPPSIPGVGPLRYPDWPGSRVRTCATGNWSPGAADDPALPADIRERVRFVVETPVSESRSIARAQRRCSAKLSAAACGREGIVGFCLAWGPLDAILLIFEQLMEFNRPAGWLAPSDVSAYCQYPICVNWVEVLVLFAIQRGILSHSFVIIYQWCALEQRSVAGSPLPC